jgi:hypothetical protein
MPLPPALAASTELRRITVTLAWLTPTNQQHKDYRKAQLWIDVAEEEIGTQRDGLDAPSARRGTVEHRIFKGAAAIPFVDGKKMRILMNCKEDAGKLDVAIPYAIAVTLEVGPDIQIDIYQRISARIRQPVGIQAVPVDLKGKRLFIAALGNEIAVAVIPFDDSLISFAVRMSIPRGLSRKGSFSVRQVNCGIIVSRMNE